MEQLMGYDNPQRGSAGAIVAIVAVFVALLLGGLVVLVVGGWFFMRAEVRETEMVARVEADRAVVEMEKAEELAARVEVAESAKVELLETPARALTIEIDQDGAITVDGERTDFDDLNARIQETGEDSDVRLTVQLKVHPRCLAQHVVAVQSACSELGVQDVQMSTLETQSSDTTGEDGSVTEVGELP